MAASRAYLRLATAVMLSFAGLAVAQAQSIEQFFRGRTVDLIIPNAPGGSFDLYGRLVATHLGRFIPGNPTIVPQNMPGAAGMVSANWLYGKAPKDGTAIGISVPNIALAQVLGTDAIGYDVHKFNWIGRIVSPTATLFVWHTAATQTIADLKKYETIVASTGPLSQAEITSAMMNGVVDTKFKIIRGYSGTGDAVVALERGEVEAAVMPWTFMRLTHPDWLGTHRVDPVAQYTRKPIADLSAVPSIFELAETPDQRGVFNLFFGPDEIGQSLYLPPGVAADRVAALREAFEAMMKDPEFRADAARQQLDLTPASWQDLGQSVTDAFTATEGQIDTARKYYH
jgi:tripartite-type tricarboxylate transporter receptor subunit TctC